MTQVHNPSELAQLHTAVCWHKERGGRRGGKSRQPFPVTSHFIVNVLRRNYFTSLPDYTKFLVRSCMNYLASDNLPDSSFHRYPVSPDNGYCSDTSTILLTCQGLHQIAANGICTSFQTCLLISLGNSNYSSSVIKTVFHAFRAPSWFPHGFPSTMVSQQELIERLPRACDNMSGPKSFMNRMQASAVNSPEDEHSAELALVTGVSNSSCNCTANSTSVRDKINPSPL